LALTKENIMSNLQIVELICPYCGNKTIYRLKDHPRPQIVLCDIDDSPGCGEYFAVGIVMVPEVTYYTIIPDRG
jgi:hypothetical protein